MNRLRTVAPIVLILAAPMAMLYPLWANPLSVGEDDLIYYYPLRKMVAEQLRQGHWPVYNPREAAGIPLAADPQAAVMYPPTWLFAAMDAKLAYSLNVFIAFSIAGSGAWLYLRRLGLRRAAAAFGAIAFMFCGFMVGHRVHLSIISAAAFLPWGLWAIELMRQRPGRALVVMAPVAFLTLAAGHWPTLIHVGVIWSAYLLLRGRPLGRSVLVGAAAMALAALVAAPQLAATADLLAHTTRNRIGYAMASENSFYPASALLAMFPMLFGTRAPNVFSQPWWGPWHLCETLGYVGLVTLSLAGAAVWRMYRRGKGKKAAPCDSQLDGPPAVVEQFRPVVRVWTWIAIGAGLWMLGCYLPTYMLIYKVLGVVRCPSRMVLAVDMALATLAAVTIHVVSSAPAAGEWTQRLARCVRRGCTVWLPLAMILALVALAAAGWISQRFAGGYLPIFCGSGADAIAAVRPDNPAVWIPLLTALATVAVAAFWLARPQSAAPVLVVLLLADLFVITRFVDFPSAAPADPDSSPAAAWLKANAGEADSYRILSLEDLYPGHGLNDTYYTRATELLRPKTAQAMGFRTINSYGPFESPAHAQLLGFNIFGGNRDWPRLVRTNYLLSLYNVRYILALAPEHLDVLESVTIPAGPRAADGPNLLRADWRLQDAELQAGPRGQSPTGLRLATPVMWRTSTAWQTVRLQPGQVYRILLDARGAEGGAANSLRAELFRQFDDGRRFEHDDIGLTVSAEQMAGDWRHFEWAFRAPSWTPDEVQFRLTTQSERTIEVRNISLCASSWDEPFVPPSVSPPAPGQHVYRDLTPQGLPPLKPGSPRIHIYENLLCRNAGPSEGRQDEPIPAATPQDLERLKWSPQSVADWKAPPVAIPASKAWQGVLPQVACPAGVGAWAIMTVMLLRDGRRRER